MLGEVSLGRTLHGTAHPEVDDLDAGFGVRAIHEHVGRLQVSMDDEARVGKLERIADLEEETEPLAKPKRVGLGEHRDRHPIDELGDQARPPIREDFVGQETADVFVIECREERCFSHHAHARLGARQPLVEDLDGHGAVERFVLNRPVDIAAPAAADERSHAQAREPNLLLARRVARLGALWHPRFRRQVRVWQESSEFLGQQRVR
ncbi:MAG: hypothetical protein AAGD00_03615 [Planctomycetota bacterium]